MKKIIPYLLIISLFLLNSKSLLAQSVSVDQAIEIGRNHLLTVSKNYLKSSSIKKESIQFSKIQTVSENEDTLLYILNDPINKGFVIVSADSRVWPIIGYSMDGNLDEANQSPAFTEWMANVKLEIAQIKNDNLLPEKGIIAAWNNLLNLKSGSTTSVAPLLKTTWDQGCFYNEQCPIDKDGTCGHVFTGCTITALAQIMKYWNYPTTGVGSHSYTVPLYGKLSADFGATNYIWSQMPNNITGSNNEIAKLMFHCGVSSDVVYNLTGSGAYLINAAEGLSKYFSYSNNFKQVYQKKYSIEDWVALLKLELESHRPILYAGNSECFGHAFVCDGYQNGNYFHFNWGWGGNANGYFFIGNLNPNGTHYNLMQEAIINICPDKLPQGYNGFSLTTNALQVSVNKATTSVKAISSVNWTVSSNQSWITTNVNSGSSGTTAIELAFDENISSKTRTAILSFSTAEYGTQIITVKQPARINVKAGGLHDALTGELAITPTLTLTGTIDVRDFKTMRDEMPLLEEIDLSNVSILAYTGSDGTDGNKLKTYEANTIPTFAFNNILAGIDSIPSILHKIVFPLTATTIDNMAFHRCNGLKSIEIPATIENIGNFAFTDSEYLTYIKIPSSVKSIGVNIFMNCPALKEIEVDNNNSNYSGFEGVLFDKQQTSLLICPAKKQGDFKIPSTVKTINSCAFIQCDQLNSILIPASVNTIGELAFDRCSAFIAVEGNNTNYSSSEGVLFNKSQTKLIFCPTSKNGDYVIPSTVTSIDKQAFLFCSNLSSVIIPNSVQSIEKSTFSNCRKMSSIDIPSSVISIGDYAFNLCQSLTSVNIPSSVTTIGSNAFSDCTSLTSVKIPSSVTTIGSNAFQYCSKLSSIIANNPIPINLSGDNNKDVFLNSNKSTCILYVPTGSKKSYQAADQWKDFTNIIEMANQIPTAIAGADQSVAEGTLVKLDGSLSSDPDGSPLTYKWTAPAGISLSSNASSKPTFTAPNVSQPTTYTISLVVNDGLADSPACQVKIVVNPLPTAAGVINGEVVVCQGQGSITYSVAAIANSTSYIWTLPSGTSGTSSTNSITVNYSPTAVSGNIIVKGHNAFGDGISSTLAINVKALPIQASTISGISTVCQGQNAVTYTVPIVTNATSYVWALPTGSTGTSITNTITVNFGATAVSGNISVKGHNDCGDGTASTLPITVNPLPATPIISQNGKVLSSNAPSGNQWYNLNNPISGATNQDYTITAVGEYCVQVTKNGCVSAPSNMIKDVITSITAVEYNEKIKVYPNPVSDDLTIEYKGNTDEIKYGIYNSAGQLVTTGMLLENTVIHTSSFSSGVYTIKFNTGINFDFRKVIKRN